MKPPLVAEDGGVGGTGGRGGSAEAAGVGVTSVGFSGSFGSGLAATGGAGGGGTTGLAAGAAGGRAAVAGRLPLLRLRIPPPATGGIKFRGGAGGATGGGATVGSMAGDSATTSGGVSATGGTTATGSAAVGFSTSGLRGRGASAGAGVVPVGLTGGLATTLGRVCTRAAVTGGMTDLGGPAVVRTGAAPALGPFFTRSFSASTCSGSSEFSWFFKPEKPSSCAKATSSLLARFSSLASSNNRTFLSFSLVVEFCCKRNSCGDAPSAPEASASRSRRVCRNGRFRPE